MLLLLLVIRQLDDRFKMPDIRGSALYIILISGIPTTIPGHVWSCAERLHRHESRQRHSPDNSNWFCMF